MYHIFMLAILSTLLLQAESCLSADSKNLETEKNVGIASKNIANAAKKLTTGKTFKVSMNWGENLEVKEVRLFAAAKRVAVIYNVLNFLEENDEIVFDKLKTNEFHLAASVITRLRALSYLGALVASTENELIIKDYIEGEISDLKLVLAHRIPYGIYRSSRKMRDDKRTMLLMTDKGFIEELFNIELKKDPLPKKLANITTIIAYSDMTFPRNFVFQG